MYETNPNTVFENMNHNDVDRRHLPVFSEKKGTWIDQHNNVEQIDGRVSVRRLHDCYKLIMDECPGLLKVNLWSCFDTIDSKIIPMGIGTKITKWKMLMCFIVPPIIALCVVSKSWWSLLFVGIFVIPYVYGKITHPMEHFVRKFLYRSRGFASFVTEHNLVSISDYSCVSNPLVAESIVYTRKMLVDNNVATEQPA
jgi:uncharacterized membrane protein